MKKNIILWMAASAVVMLAFPWLAVTFVKGDAGMAVCFLLFFAVNPLYSVIIGVFAGKNIRHLWSFPVVSAALFPIGTWIFFDMGETAFILYAALLELTYQHNYSIMSEMELSFKAKENYHEFLFDKPA